MTIGTKISLGLGVLALLVAGGLYMGRETLGVIADETQEKATTTTEMPTGKKMAFEQFAKQEGTYKCTVNQSVNGQDIKGTVYMDKGMLRGEFTANYGGQSMDVHFIVRDNTTYAWNSMMPTMGYKFKNDVAVQAGNVQANASGAVTASPNDYLQQIGDYTCAEWSGDASLFTVPTSVTFRAMN